MKKFLLMIILFLIIPLNCLASSWSNFYDESSKKENIQNYTKVIKDGFKCTYESDDFDTFDSFTFNFSRNGWILKLPKGTYTICDSNTCKNYDNSFKYQDKDIYFGSFQVEEFLDNYLSLNSCPSNLYLEDSDIYGVVFYSHYINSTQTAFSLDSANSTVSEPDADTGCLVSDAYCKDFSINTDDGIYYVQIGSKDDGVYTEDTKYFAVSKNSNYSDNIKKSFTNINSSVSLTYDGNTFTIETDDISYIYKDNNTFTSNLSLEKSDIYDNVYLLKTKPVTSNNESVDVPTLDVEEIVFCERNETRKTFQIIGYVIFFAKIIVPLLLIILGSIDFAKAVISNSDKAPQDALKAFGIRIIIAVIIFLIPTILSFLIGLIDGASETFEDTAFSDCSDCLLDPFGKCKAEDIVK